MKIADFLIALFPGIISSVLLWLSFDYIMDAPYVPSYFLVFMAFANAMDCISYMLTHFFSDPETAVKYVSLVSSLGLLLAPMIGFFILGAIAGGDTGIEAAMSALYFVSPLFTFWMTTQNLCYAGDEDREEAQFEISGGTAASMPIALGVFTYQFVIMFIVLIYVDHLKMNGYKKRGGTDGAQPPHLPVR